jgi:uncharacterized protein (UPF0276 family)
MSFPECDSDIRRELGVGLIYNRELDSLLDGSHPQVSVVELEPQTLWEKVSNSGQWYYKPNQAAIDKVASYPLAKLMHGIGQPLGGAVPDPVEHLSLLSETADHLDAVWVSEHLSFNRVATPMGVAETGFLLPPPQSRAGVQVAVQNVVDYGAALRRPVAFETGVSYLQPRSDEMSDAEFWSAVAEGADSGILLDLHNLWCNELNGRWRVLDVIERLPLERVWEIHLAGGMPMDGYWLDAHSDRIPKPLMDIAAQVIPRLPNLGALMFELLPEHFETVGIDGVCEQIAELSELWKLRSPARARFARPSPVREPTAQDLAEVRTWETALYNAIVGTAPPDPAFPELGKDPGIRVYRELVTDFRRGHLAQAMHYTMTLLLIGLGTQDTSELLETYCSERPAQMYRALEVESFARFLTQRSELLDRTPYLREVLSYEHALIKATVLGEDSQIEWTADPTAILGALDRGQLPPTLPVVSSSMLIST